MFSSATHVSTQTVQTALPVHGLRALMRWPRPVRVRFDTDPMNEHPIPDAPDAPAVDLSPEGLGVLPFPIQGAECTNCGQPLAWCSGVGRLVIRHATGEAICAPPTTAHLSESDTEKAKAALVAADQAFVTRRAAAAGSPA